MDNRADADRDEPPSRTDRARVDQLCDEFESMWRNLTIPRIEDFLPQCDERLRPDLFDELSRIEKHWRSRSSDPDLSRDALLARFPEYEATIITVWGAPRNPQQGLLAAPSAIGPYQDPERIGEGGFGVVYRAWDSRHERMVALKLPRFGYELAEQGLDRFLREAKAAGSLDHPGIARVWDSGRVDGVTYIAYQFIEGENLRDRLEEVALWPYPRIARLMRQLAEAVDYAHQQGVIHRDIKPSNILLTKDDRPVLTDFGLALAVGGDATRSLAARVGTVDYMSPEQASGDSARVDGRADLWSLGVVMYELVTGQKPFSGGNDVEVLRAVLEYEPRSPSGLSKRLPRDLDVLTMRCLQKSRSDRLASCELLAKELQRIELGQPILSRPVSFVERSVRWCRRNPRPVAAFSLILLATAFGAWSWGGWLRDRRQNENRVQQLQIQVEAGQAQRRQILRDLLGHGDLQAALSGEDLEFIETQLLSSDDEALRRRAAELLIRNQWFESERFHAADGRAGRSRDAIRAVLESGSALLDEGARNALREALEHLPLDAAEPEEQSPPGR